MDFEADLYGRVGPYEEIWNVVNDIVHPKKAAKTLKIEAQAPINKEFGLLHAIRFESRPPSSNPFAPPPDPPNGCRSYHLGAYLSKRSPEGYRTLATSSVGTNGDSISSLEKQFSSSFRARVALWTKPKGNIYHCLSSSYTGTDYTVGFKCANLNIAHISYLQRLGSFGVWNRILVGGEGMFDKNSFLNIQKGKRAEGRPFYFSVGGSYSDRLNRILVGWYRPVQVQHGDNIQLAYQRNVTEHTTLVAKAEIDMREWTNKVFAGYRIRFPRTRSIMTGSIDTNQTCKVYFERRLLSNVRFGVHGTVQPAPKVIPGQGPMPQKEPTSWGLHLKIGSVPQEPLNLSPSLLRNHVVFHK